MLVYVDDIFIDGYSKLLVDQLVSNISLSLTIKDFVSLNYFLGIEVTHNSWGITLFQHKYASDLIHQAHMENFKRVSVRSHFMI